MVEELRSQVACFLAIYCRSARYLRQSRLAGYSASLAWRRTPMVGKCFVAYNPRVSDATVARMLAEQNVLSESKTRGHIVFRLDLCHPHMAVIITKIGLGCKWVLYAFDPRSPLRSSMNQRARAQFTILEHTMRRGNEAV